jgi:signal transduction histidine kinase
VIQSSVLIVSDDPEFARNVAARWQSERHVPAMTLVTGDVWQPVNGSSCDLVIVGAVRNGKSSSLLSALNNSPHTATIYVTEDEKDIPFLHSEYPTVLFLPRQDGWMGMLILLSGEILRRVEATGRAQRAERLALEYQSQATLGRYMLEMRPSVNNALTSVIGNADLLLLEPGQAPGDTQEQIRTIHTMALRLNEVMQRFSSLASEMRAAEKESHTETGEASQHALSGFGGKK